jgi:hypothetical protein
MNNDEAMAYWALEGDERKLAEAEPRPIADVFPIYEIKRNDRGEPVEVRHAAWGLALPDRTEVVSVRPGLYARCESVDSAMRFFGIGSEVGTLC